MNPQIFSRNEWLPFWSSYFHAYCKVRNKLQCLRHDYPKHVTAWTSRPASWREAMHSPTLSETHFLSSFDCEMDFRAKKKILQSNYHKRHYSSIHGSFTINTEQFSFMVLDFFLKIRFIPNRVKSVSNFPFTYKAFTYSFGGVCTALT